MNKPTVLAENEWLIAVNKPAGLICHSDGRTKELSLADWLVARFPYLADVGEPWISPQGETIIRPGMVHRLDRTTSGVMLIAKTAESFEFLKAEFKARRVAKLYRAIVHGAMEAHGEVVLEIVRTKTVPRRWMAETAKKPHRAAITEWTAIRSGSVDGAVVTFVNLEPRTGRTHQLRVHMSAIGHAIVGDVVYGPSLDTLGAERPLLHAHAVRLVLPDGNAASYSAPEPSDMTSFAMRF
jgi:23S rRNA pseudouridine1911/1915/1917 synthase